jgi:nucleotide-binding universal stress UspA family protein
MPALSDMEKKLQHILLPLDVSRDSLTALEIAFGLASAIGGEISGLFIEDEALLMAGSLPFAREVGSFSGISRQIGSADIETRFQAMAGKARAALAEAGRRLNVPSSFRITRGDVPAQILAAAADADMVVLGKAGWSAGILRKPGSTCLAILSNSRVPVLIAERGVTLAPPILVVNDGTPAGKRAVDFAAELARSLGWEIGVFSSRGASKGNDVLQCILPGAKHLIVLPSSLPLSERASELKHPILFVP